MFEWLIGGLVVAVVLFVAYKKIPWFHTKADEIYDKVDDKLDPKDPPVANTGS